MQHGYGYFEEDKLGHVADAGLWRRIIAYTAPRWRGVTAAIVLAFVVTGSSLALPYLVRIGIDRYIVTTAIGLDARLHGLLVLSMVFAVIIVIGFLANFFQVIILEWTGQTVMHQMRQQLFAHLLGLDLGFFSNSPSGKLVTRLTNDIQNMHEMFTSVIITLFNDFIKVIGILVLLFLMDWRLALILSVMVPVMVLNTTWFSKLARDAFRAIRTHLARINSYLQESVSGLAVIQIFLRERETLQRFADLNREYFRKTLYQIKIFGFFMPTIELFNAVSIGCILWYGGGQIIKGHMSLGVLVAFLSYMRLFFQPVRELAQKYSIVQSAMASAERIFQLLDTKPALEGRQYAAMPDRVRGVVEFKAVSFGYDPQMPILHDLSFAVGAGETLAIVGATGSGKTTIINLLERFYEPAAGRILLDGSDLAGLDPDWLRRQIGLVLQDVLIVPGSVRRNILLDAAMDDRRLEKILEDSQLSRFVRHLPQGLETRIGEGGLDLSAGQKQLLAFARVLARDPKVLVLDEATSSIDSETEMFIDQAIETTLAGRTGIVIAHRLSTIRRADNILVLDGGHIVEQGNHQSLMGKKGVYFHLQQLQRYQNGQPMPA